MHIILVLILSAAGLGAETVVEKPAAADGIVGFWQTHDDKTGELKGLVEISAAGDSFHGILRETYKKNAKTLCAVCPGDKKDKPYKGLEIVWGVKPTGAGEWGEGHIMDPENGKDYRVKLALQKDGAELKVRGYIGVSLFGRTQVWTRGTKPN